MLRLFYKIILEWNPNVKRRYGTVDFDIAEIISMEAVFPKLDILVRFSQGSVMKQGSKLNHFTIKTDEGDVLQCWCLYLITKSLQAFNFIAKDSTTGVLLRILQNI